MSSNYILAPLREIVPTKVRVVPSADAPAPLHQSVEAPALRFQCVDANAPLCHRVEAHTITVPPLKSDYISSLPRVSAYNKLRHPKVSSFRSIAYSPLI